jgi:hypothetical protein
LAVTAEQSRKSNRKPQDNARYWMASSDMNATQPRLPLVCDSLSLAMFWLLPRVDVVAKLVVERASQYERPHKLQAERPCRSPVGDSVDKELDPRLLSAPSGVIEAAYLYMAGFAATGPTPAAAPLSCERSAIGQHNRAKPAEVFDRHRVEQLLNGGCGVEPRREVFVGFVNGDHRT